MNEKLNILWITDNKDTVFNLLSMYAINSINRGWWNHINVILWGASVKLVANDTQVQTEVLEMIHAGITIEACQDCHTFSLFTGQITPNTLYLYEKIGYNTVRIMNMDGINMIMMEKEKSASL